MQHLAFAAALLLASIPSQTIVTGLDAPEDILVVNGGNAVLASSLNAGGLYVVDVKTKAVSRSTPPLSLRFLSPSIPVRVCDRPVRSYPTVSA
jgi:hypothetical protein